MVSICFGLSKVEDQNEWLESKQRHFHLEASWHEEGPKLRVDQMGLVQLMCLLAWLMIEVS